MFGAWAILSLTWSVDSAPSYIRASVFAALPLGALAGWLLDQRAFRNLAYGLSLAGLALALFTWHQSLSLAESGPVGLLLNRNNHAAVMGLLLLPAVGLFLARGSTAANVFRALALVLIASAIGLAGSRGALAALAGALALLLWLARPEGAARRQYGAAIALVAAGLLAGNFAGDRNGLERIAGSVQGADAVEGAFASRLAIWDASLAMAAERPYLGHGIGTFFLEYPRYRSAEDHSAGKHVHNDYLEILVELGPVGLALLIGLIALIAREAPRVRRGPWQPQERYLLAGIAAGLAGCFAHSLLTFNLYHLAILLLVGLFAGQLASGSRPEGAPAAPRPARLTPLARTLALIAVFYLPLYWFGLIFAFDTLVEKSRHTGKLTESIEILEEAQRIYPYQDVTPIQIASVLNGVMGRKQLPDDVRDLLVERALLQLESARSYAPSRWQNYYLEASLLRKLPAAPERNTRIGDAYRRALSLNPRYLKARIDYADYLMASGEAEGAFGLLKAGWNRPYFDNHADMVGYLHRLADLSRDFSRDRLAQRAESVAASIRAYQERTRYARSTKFLGEPRPDDGPQPR